MERAKSWLRAYADDRKSLYASVVRYASPTLGGGRQARGIMVRVSARLARVRAGARAQAAVGARRDWSSRRRRRSVVNITGT